MEIGQGSLNASSSLLTIVLVEPQLGENIGSVARVMKNFHLHDLRLVRPRDGWPNPEAVPLAAGADDVLEGLQVFDSLREATRDLHHIFGTSGRGHDVIKEFYTPRGAVEALSSPLQGGDRVGILFGNERSGLTNEDISLCEALIAIPSNSAFPSLNLSQAVGVLAYEWAMASQETSPVILRTGHTLPATREEIWLLFEHLEGALLTSGFLRNAKKRPTMVQNLRNIFQRSQLTEQEVRTLRGVIRSLVETGSSKK